MNFASWSKAVDTGVVTAGSQNLNPVAVGRDSGLPEDLFEHGWNNLSEVLGLNASSGYLFGRNSAAISLAVMCADVIATDISKAEMLLYKLRAGTRGYDLVSPTAHPIAKLFRLRPHPDHNWTWPEILRMQVLHLKLTENCYWLKDGFRLDGSFKGLIPIQPARVRARVAPSGKLFYEIFAGTEHELAIIGDTSILVPAERMIHIRGRMMDGLYGLSSLALGTPIFDIMSAIAAYQKSVFENEGGSNIIFETEDTFGDDAKGNAAFERIKRQLTNRVNKMRTKGEPILLEAKLKAKVISNKSTDNESKDSFNQQVMRVCGLMKCPPHKIFALDGVAYNNADAMNRAYFSDSLDPIATLIQEAFRLNLFSDDEALLYSPQFDGVKLMANDLPTLTKMVDVAMKYGGMTFDEFREVMPFRFGAIKKGGRRLIPVNMAVVDENGDVVVNAASGQNANQPPTLEPEGEDDTGQETETEAGKSARLSVVR
jgi:HK97 family phage portal protein